MRRRMSRGMRAACKGMQKIQERKEGAVEGRGKEIWVWVWRVN